MSACTGRLANHSRLRAASPLGKLCHSHCITTFALMSWRRVRSVPSRVWQHGWRGCKQMRFEKFPERLELGMLGEIALDVHEGARHRRAIPAVAFHHSLIRKGPQRLEAA